MLRVLKLAYKMGPGQVTLAHTATQSNTPPHRLALVCEILEELEFIEWDRSTNMIRWRGTTPSFLLFDQVGKDQATLDQLVRVLHKEDELLEDWIQFMQVHLRQFAEIPEVKKLQYILASDIRSLEMFKKDTMLAVHAPVGTTCEIPHPEDGLTGDECRFQVFIRTEKGSIPVNPSVSVTDVEEKKAKPKVWHVHASLNGEDEDGNPQLKVGNDKNATLLSKTKLKDKYYEIIGSERLSVKNEPAPMSGIGYDQWCAYFDTASSQVYYYNHDTDGVQWELPFEVQSSRTIMCGHCGKVLSKKRLKEHRECCEMRAPRFSKITAIEKKRRRWIVSDVKSGPPKPINAFLMFCRKNRRKFMNEVGNAGKAPSQISKILGQRWCLLSDAKKKHYREMSKQENLSRRKAWEKQKNGKKKRKTKK